MPELAVRFAFGMAALLAFAALLTFIWWLAEKMGDGGLSDGACIVVAFAGASLVMLAACAASAM